MSIIRFSGKSSREAMRQVRESLGEDALILANRRTEEGVEILAMADAAIQGMTTASAAQTPYPAAEATLSPAATTSAREATLNTTSEQLLREMQDMRALLSRETARHADPDNLPARLRTVLQQAGFSAALASELLNALPAELSDSPRDDTRAIDWLQRRMAARLLTLDHEVPFFDPPGVVSLVGPTGVGKTTTTAKLAARFVQRHGANHVALVTTDSFRIGAHEQLKIYAELLGIPMHALAPGEPIDSLAKLLRGRRWVIVDTVGMSQRDHRVIEQIGQLQGGRVRVRMVLLLNAASQPETLEEVATRYCQAARAAGAKLEDCLLTKQDEAGCLAPALETIIRHGLRLAFVSHGQRVPEDLSLPDTSALIVEALATRKPLPLAAQNDGTRSRLSSGHAMASSLLGQGRVLSTLMNGLRRRVSGFRDLESAWDIASLPHELQAPRLDALLEQAERNLERSAMVWAPRRTVARCDWALPDLALDGHGHWLAMPNLQHRQPVGQRNRLANADETLDIKNHLLTALPDAETWQWLERSDAVWCCQVRAGQRVAHGKERHALSALVDLALPSTQAESRLRGQPCRVSLSQLPVTLVPARSKGNAGQLLTAWFGTLCDPDTGKTLGQRYWLTNVRERADALPFIVIHLQAEGVALQTRRAWERLATLLPSSTRPELRLLLAAGLATCAKLLEHSQEEAVLDLRSELLGLLGARRRRLDTALLEAMLHLFNARDAIRQIGSASLEEVK